MKTFKMLQKVDVLKKMVNRDQIFDFDMGVTWLRVLIEISDKILTERNLKACDLAIGFKEPLTDNEKVRKIGTLLESYIGYPYYGEPYDEIRMFLSALRGALQDKICGKCMYSGSINIEDCWEHCKSHYLSSRERNE